MKNQIRYINLNKVSPEIYTSLWEYENVIELRKPTIIKFNTDRTLAIFWQGPYWNEKIQDWDNIHSDLSDYFNAEELADIFKVRVYEKIEISYGAEMGYYIEGPDVVNFIVLLPDIGEINDKNKRKKLDDDFRQILVEILEKRNIETKCESNDIFYKHGDKWKKFFGSMYRPSANNFGCINMGMTYNFESNIADRIRKFDSEVKVKKFDVNDLQEIVGGLYEVYPEIDREKIEIEYVTMICKHLNLSIKEEQLTSEEEQKLFERGKRRLTEKEWYLYGNNDGFEIRY